MTKQEVLELLTEIKDPDIPIVDIVEMGFVREIKISNKSINVKITPTYSGCPAVGVIEDDIKTLLKENGFSDVNVEKIYSPAWTTDWIGKETKEKMRQHGIAPPQGQAPQSDDYISIPVMQKIICPYCSSDNTQRKSEFGSTACKALYYCNACNQPFEYFKCI